MIIKRENSGLSQKKGCSVYHSPQNIKWSVLNHNGERDVQNICNTILHAVFKN